MALAFRHCVHNALSQSRTRTFPRLVSSSSPLSYSRPSFSVNVNKRAMSSSSSTGRKYEWLVVVPDFPGALAKRVEVRAQHFAGLKPNLDSGRFQMGGAILDEVPADDEPSSLKMSGSTLVIVAESKEEILSTLREDVYAKSGVWNVDNAQMWPLKCAFRIPFKQ